MFPRLEERRTQRGALLSGGEQQMLAIGRALMSEPRLLLLDEPSLGLARRSSRQIARVIREIHEQGTSVVLVEQNAAMALEVADRASVLEVGRLTLEGSAAEAGPRATRCASATSASANTSAVAEALAEGPARPKREGEAERRRVSELSVENVSVRFGGLLALSEVSFTVAPGTVHAVIGPNGAGKSTCLNVLTGVYEPSAGRVRYGDDVLTGLRPAPHRAPGHQPQRPEHTRCRRTRPGTRHDNLLLGRHRLSRAGFVTAGLGLPRVRRERRAQLERVPRDRRRGRPRAPARPPGRGPALWRPQAHRGWPGRCAPTPACCCSTSRWPA